MKRFLAWWYRLTLPPDLPENTPHERERRRYAYLTASITLLSVLLFLPLSPIMIFFSPDSPSSPPIAFAMIGLLTLSIILGKLGRQRLSGSILILYYFLAVTGPIATNPLDPSLIPLFSTYMIAIILSGAILPPYAAFISGALSCVLVVSVSLLVPPSPTYRAILEVGQYNPYTVSILLPVVLQIITSFVVFGIMTNLVKAIKRADRAEEIIALQNEVASFERSRAVERDALESGLRTIAEAHARIANGDLQARVSLHEGHVLWSVAVPLNNLLNRLQRLKLDADELQMAKRAAQYVAENLRYALVRGRFQPLMNTGTLLDPVILEINNLSNSSRNVDQRFTQDHAK